MKGAKIRRKGFFWETNSKAAQILPISPHRECRENIAHGIRFYYSASWCGPCQAYTPSLVNLYNKIKPGNPKFELVFVSADRDEKSMEGYMKDKKMPWPALKLSAVGGFEKKHNHGVRGIPSVVVCDLEGKIVVKTNGTAKLEKLLTE